MLAQGGGHSGVPGSSPQELIIDRETTNKNSSALQVAHSGGLLWVHKSPDSWLTGRKDAKPINSHVQRVYAEKRRESRLKQLRVSRATRYVDRTMVTSSSSSLHGSDRTRVSQKTQMAPSIDRASSYSEESDKLDSTSPDLTTANFRKQDCVDPFDAICISLDANSYKIIQYYVTTCLPHTLKAQVELQPSHPVDYHHQYRHTTRRDETMRGCFTNKVHMYALLAINCGRMIQITGVKHMPLVQPQYYMCKALHALREQLASDADIARDRQIILTLVWLMTYEWYFSDFEAAITHKKAIKRIRPILDESDEYERYLKDVSSRSDVFMASENLSAPVLPRPEAPMEEYPRWAKVPLHIMRVGGGFVKALLNGHFSPLMAPIVADIVPCMQVWRYTQTSDNALPEDVAWTSRKIHYILYRLLSLTSREDLSKDEPVSAAILRPEEECIRITMVILLCYVTTHTVNRSGPRNAVRLAAVIREIPLNPVWDVQAETKNEMLLWALIIGHFAAEISDSTSDTSKWFEEQAAATARLLGIEEYAQLHRLMERYCWIEKLHQVPLRRLATSIARQTNEDSGYAMLPFVPATPEASF